MVRISFLAISAVALASFFAPTAFACESECRIYPVKFLADKYAVLLQERLASLSAADRTRLAGQTQEAIKGLQGRGGVIDETIFSKFRKNCHDKPPHRSPDEICGSAKSIACFAPWGHKQSIFEDVHEAVVDSLEEYKGDAAWKSMVQDVKGACPQNCQAWVDPFQKLMLGWEQREHHDVYGSRTPNCARGRLGY